MRILSGKLKGRNFYMPHGIRPTSDIIRKSVFDILGQELEGLSFLDLFAGSGAMGFEAISRGAKNVVFVEKDLKCFKVVEENMVVLEMPYYERKECYFDTFKLDAFAAIKEFARKKRQFDIIFIDPPYSRELAKKALKTLVAHDIVFSNSLLVFQHDKREGLPDQQGRFSLFKTRKYGASLVTIYRSS